MAMKDLGDGQRAKARALMPEVARIVKPTAAGMGPRSMVTAPGTVRNFAKGGAVKHDDVKQDKAMIRGMVKPSALKKADGGAARAHAAPGTSTGTKVERMAAGGAAARANATGAMPASGTAVMHKKSGGKACMATGGSVTSGLGSGKAAGAPAAAPRAKSSGMKPASLKMASGGVAKSRKVVMDKSGKPAPLPKAPRIPVNMSPPSKRR